MCFYTLGSPTRCPKRVLSTAEYVVRVVRGGWVPGGYTGVYQGGYTRVGTGEGYTGTQLAAARRVLNQRSGPRKPLQGAGVGGFRARGLRWAGRLPGTTPAGPGRPAASLYLGPLEMPTYGQYGEIPLHFTES